MGGLFSSPDVPAAPTPPAPSPAPTMDNASANQRNRDQQAMRKGRASTILTGNSGDLSSPNVGTKTLLGS